MSGTARLSAIALLALAAGASAAPPLKDPDLRTQKVGSTTYFRVRFDMPPDYVAPTIANDWGDRPTGLGRLPRLVSREGAAAIHGGVELPDRFNLPQPSFVFYGKSTGTEAKCLLLYPTESEAKLPPLIGKVAGKRTVPSWAEVPVTLKFAKAEALAEPASVGKRRAWREKDGSPPVPDPDDLEGRWARAQTLHFGILALQAGGDSFFDFAGLATNRKYHISSPDLPRWWNWPGRSGETARLYELTTGATAVAESLQINRLLGTNPTDTGPRDIDAKTLRGIDIKQHPWVEMIGDKKPADEPLAALVPHDHYYVTFRSLPKLAATRHLLDAWGGNVMSAFSLSTRDYGLFTRYERQLCLSADGLAAAVPASAIRGVAVTGSDGYLVEGSDVTVLIDAADVAAFRKVADATLDAARKEWGGRLREGKDEYAGVTIERFVTQYREVSLHRATVGGMLVYSNSPAGIRRVIDTAQGKREPLAKSLDFRYMRTIYRADDPAEDGFCFLSDPFVRQLVGPASRIARKRRTEAQAGLTLATNAALFAAWETGRMPEEDRFVLASLDLKPGMLAMPTGKDAAFDPREGRATHAEYGTLAFLTPLIEMPIEKVTRQEADDYERFRLEYLGLWRRYFDPIGMRIGLTEKAVKLEAYILPLIENTAYNDLRRMTGGGTTTLDPASISPKTIFQLTQHVNLEELARQEFLGRDPWAGFYLPALNFVGDWFVVRLDDGPSVERLGRIWLRTRTDPRGEMPPPPQLARIIWQTPLTVGASVKNPLTLAALLATAKQTVGDVLPGGVEWGPLDGELKEVVRVRPKPNGEVARLFGSEPGERTPFVPSIYYGLMDGALFVGLNEDSMKELTASRHRREKPGPNAVEVNSSVYFAPGAATESLGFVKAYIEYETHRRALATLPSRYALYRTGAVAPDATPESIRAASLRLWGYEPMSPDGTGIEYRAATDEAASVRHGTLRRPKLNAEPDANAPVTQLLARFRSVRADLRFKEDGVQTTITLEANPPAK